MRTALAAVCLFAGAAAGGGFCADPDPAVNQRDWTRVTLLQPGRRVTVRLHQGLGGEVRGVFVSGDVGGIAVRDRKGTELRVAREHVRSVKAGRRRRYAK